MRLSQHLEITCAASADILTILRCSYRIQRQGGQSEGEALIPFKFIIIAFCCKFMLPVIGLFFSEISAFFVSVRTTSFLDVLDVFLCLPVMNARAGPPKATIC